MHHCLNMHKLTQCWMSQNEANILRPEKVWDIYNNLPKTKWHFIEDEAWVRSAGTCPGTWQTGTYLLVKFTIINKGWTRNQNQQSISTFRFTKAFAWSWNCTFTVTCSFAWPMTLGLYEWMHQYLLQDKTITSIQKLKFLNERVNRTRSPVQC